MKTSVKLSFISALLACFMVFTIAHANSVDAAKAGELARDRGDNDQAIRLFTIALSSRELSDRDRAIVLSNRGGAYANKGQLGLAIADLSESIRLLPRADGYHNRALAYAKNKQYDLAINDYTETIRLEPAHVRAYNGRGLVYAVLMQYDRAIADFDAVIRLKPDHTDAYVSRGIARSRSGQSLEAIADYSEAIRMNPDLVRAYRSRGVDYFALGKFSDAAADFEQAKKLNSSDAYVLLWLHLARSKVGQATAKQLKANTGKVDLAKWPGPVISLFLNESTVEKTRAALSDLKNAHDQRCEADFFIAEHELSKNGVEEAKVLLRRVVDACPGTYEHVAAMAELKRIGK